LHSGEFGLFLHASPWLQSSADAPVRWPPRGGAAVPKGEAPGVGDGLAGPGAGFALGIPWAPAPNETPNDLSVDRCLTMTIESTLAPAAIRRPRIRIINCVRRLYQPDTRSIELLNQFSMFSLALATSLPAASIRVSKALFTCSGRILLST